MAIKHNKTSTEPYAKRPEYADPAYRAFVKQIGGRPGWKAVLEWNSDDPRAKRALEIMQDPAFDSYGVKKVNQDAGITFYDATLFYREMILRGGVVQMFHHIPQMLVDAAMDAQAGVQECPRCDGEGEIVKGKGDHQTVKTCPRCNGNGTIRRSGDTDARNFVGKAAGIIDKGGPLVQINTQVNNNSGTSSLDTFEELMKRSKAIESPRRQLQEPTQQLTAAIEAELVKVEKDNA